MTFFDFVCSGADMEAFRDLSTAGDNGFRSPIDEEVAFVKLRAMGKTIDTLTKEQKEYLGV